MINRVIDLYQLKRELLIDSYDHYRIHVGCSPIHSLWRALAYEVTGREKVCRRHWWCPVGRSDGSESP